MRKQSKANLRSAYDQMSKDFQRERDAHEWSEGTLLNPPAFLKRVAKVRGSLKAAKGVRREDLAE